MTKKTTPSKKNIDLSTLSDQTLIDQLNHEFENATKLRDILEKKEVHIPKIINELRNRGVDLDSKLKD